MDDLETAILSLNQGVAEIHVPVLAPEPSAPEIPTIYDESTGKRRAVTQQDVNRAIILERAYDRLREHIAQIEAEHAAFVREIGAVR